MNILLVDFSANLGREDISKPTIGNKSLHKINNDNVCGVVNFVTLICQEYNVSTS
jgi:hypothetical protein